VSSIVSGVGNSVLEAVASWPLMPIGVPTESAQGERRVALAPEVVRKLAARGVEVIVAARARGAAMIPDALYEQAGARVSVEDARCGAGTATVR
jgi:NAD/NADP transhydrogenase alpha subunit